MSVAGVNSRSELIEFVRALGDDLQAKPATWENATLDRYLSASERWLEDADGYYRNQGRDVPTNPTWKDVAEMLIAATMYA